eukprot:scaffold392_cov350-Prasinococcus_capsulatus_cf.AAC.2
MERSRPRPSSRSSPLGRRRLVKTHAHSVSYLSSGRIRSLLIMRALTRPNAVWRPFPGGPVGALAGVCS